MTGRRPQIRHRSFADPRIAEAFRDVQQHFDEMVLFRVLKFERLYTEPMYLSLAYEPDGIFAMRIRTVATPDTPVAHGTAVEYSMENGRVRINTIDGMTPATPGPFHFTLLVAVQP